MDQIELEAPVIIDQFGYLFKRSPSNTARASRVYYTAFRKSDGKRAPGIKQLHVEVWQRANSRKVPKGWVIHHVDHNPFNNDVRNLVCITRKEHAAVHPGSYDRQGKSWLEHLDAIRPEAAAWHSSPEGLTWHKENGRKSWEGLLQVRLTRLSKPLVRLRF